MTELEQKTMEQYPTLLVDGHHGQYVPQVFAEQYNNLMWGMEDFDPDYQTVLKGPDEEFYWECWEAVLNKANFVHPITKVKYVLSPGEDGDLFMVKENSGINDFTVYFY